MCFHRALKASCWKVTYLRCAQAVARLVHRNISLWLARGSQPKPDHLEPARLALCGWPLKG